MQQPTQHALHDERTVLAPLDATHYIETDEAHQFGTFTDDNVAINDALAAGRLVLEVDERGCIQAPEVPASAADVLRLEARVLELEGKLSTIMEALADVGAHAARLQRVAAEQEQRGYMLGEGRTDA